MPLRSLFVTLLLAPFTLNAQCLPFPNPYIPFTKVYYVAGPNSKGDSLVVGALQMPDGLKSINNVPVPPATNAKFCDPTVELVPGTRYSNVYIPTTSERSGQFPDFSGLLADPNARNQTFPGGIIPASRLGDVFGWRIGPQGAPKPEIFPGAVLNAAGDPGTPAASPGSLISIYGRSLASRTAPATLGADGQMPAALNGTGVSLGSLAARLLFVSPGQINAQVPFELGVGRYNAVVSLDGIASATQSFTVGKTSPGIFVIVRNADFSVISDKNPARAGEAVVIFCTGLGAVSPPVRTGALAPSGPLAYTVEAPKVTIGGADVQMVGAVLSPGYVGLYQIGIIIPPTASTAIAPLVVSIGGASTKPWDLPIRGTALYPSEGIQIPFSFVYSQLTDWNGDGKLDIVVLRTSQPNSTAGAKPAVLLGRGGGIFDPPVDITPKLPVSATYPQLLGIGDINNDGLPDLVYSETNTAAPSRLLVYLNLGNGTYREVISGGSDIRQVGSTSGINWESVGYFSIVDLNRDGKPDLAVWSYHTGPVMLSLNLYLGDGAGGFTLTTSLPGFQSAPLTMKDLTGDGVSDLVTGDLRAGQPALVVRPGDGKGGLAPEVDVALPGYAAGFGDFNGDGKLDVLVASGNTLTTMLGDGKGGFKAGPATNYPPAQSYQIADFNGDGRADVLAGASSGTVQVLYSMPDGSFQPGRPVNVPPGSSASPASFDWTGGSSSGAVVDAGSGLLLLVNQGGEIVSEYPAVSLAERGEVIGVADFNRDGIPDLVMRYSKFPQDPNSSVVVSFGVSDAKFSAPVTVISNAYSLCAIADLNGDGAPDLISAGGSAVRVVLNDGTGRFAPEMVLSLPASSFSLSDLLAADVNGDGRPDLITGDYERGQIIVFLNNGDGSFRTPGLTASLPGGWAQIEAVDLNGDRAADLVASYPYTGFVVAVSNRDGSFVAPRTFALKEHPEAFQVADINGDGVPEIVFMGYGVYAINNPLAADPRPVQVADRHGSAIKLLDVNGDGFPDLLMSQSYDDLEIALNDGEGGFRAPRIFLGGGSFLIAGSESAHPKLGIFAADFNGDAKPDILGGRYTGPGLTASGVQVLLHQ